MIRLQYILRIFRYKLLSRKFFFYVFFVGFSLMRVTIGTSDFTAQDFYTYYDGTGKELDGKPDWNNVTGKGIDSTG